MKKKPNILMIVAGVLMIIVSLINYFLEEDHVSLGIFTFLGIGFVLLSFKDKYEGKKAQRFNKYAMTFFFIAIVIVLYWVAVSKFDLF